MHKKNAGKTDGSEISNKRKIRMAAVAFYDIRD